MSAAGFHSLGPTCAYYEEDLPNFLPEASDPPKVKAQFFYISSLPIDDPLSPLPPIQSDKITTHQLPQPFSVWDNAALEEAWQGFQKGDGPTKDGKAKAKEKTLRQMFLFPKFKSDQRSGTLALTAERSSEYFADPTEMIVPQGSYQKVEQPPSDVAHQILKEGDISSPSRDQRTKGVSPKEDESSTSIREQNKTIEVSRKLTKDELSAASPKKSNSNQVPREPMEAESFTFSQAEKKTKETSQQSNEPPVMPSQGEGDASTYLELVDAKDLGDEEYIPKPNRRRHISPFRSKKEDRGSRQTSPDSASASTATDGVRISSQTTPKYRSDISGRPFARAPSNRDLALRTTDGTDGTDDTDYTGYKGDSEDQARIPRSRLQNAIHPHHENKKHVFVPVGVSRLHLVEMPDLVMKPIYWQSINDTSSVIRATWFFAESMLPVPAEVANRLEIGYEDMKPFSESYQEELNACVENGAVAELKVVHKLWPDKPVSVIDPKTRSDSLVAITNTSPEDQKNAAADTRHNKSETMFETCSVIYVNGKDAQILKPNQLPSKSRNRKPLGPIRKGRQIGVAVVRGFDRKEWRKLHPNPKMDAKAAHAAIGAYMSQSGDTTLRNWRMPCSACEKEKKSKVSDLVLVIHGIGQKLSERVDSFHFTHSINSLRREFNVELASEAVKGYLRADIGIMVLPVNWRLTVSFDDGPKQGASTENNYHLSDITPDTLPGVRTLISDVMLDIPYYLSHHKQKMISAVIKEANRVYRLWCRNNPGFQENGRVHLIAHSLGSAMAMDILSQQPTIVPATLDLTTQKVGDKMFEFNTTNLFCCGSPSGIFLLLNGANLIPRKGRNKPGMEGEDKAPGIAGEAGTYGCLAVDNIYNICHRNDPIAYQQNACVDSAYAASLIPTTIPAATPGIFSRVGTSLRLMSASAAYGAVSDRQRHTMTSLPSTVEMQIHNFTREEIAEKRMYLLNDNGQIDFFLNSGGGPLEIQYLNMLSAHSSYWVLQDFVRFLVVETGRVPGRDRTLPALRAQKKREYKKGSIV
jgi:DDHD domain